MTSYHVINITTNLGTNENPATLEISEVSIETAHVTDVDIALITKTSVTEPGFEQIEVGLSPFSNTRVPMRTLQLYLRLTIQQYQYCMHLYSQLYVTTDEHSKNTDSSRARIVFC